MSDNDPFSGGNDPGTDDNDPFVGGGPSVGGDPSVGGNDPGTDDNDPFVGGGPSVGGDPSVGGNDPGTDDNDPFVGGGPSVGGNDPSVGGNGPSVGGNDPAVGGGNDPGTDDTAFPVADPNEPVVVDLGDGQSLGLSMDDGSDTVNVALALDLSAFDVFADGNPFSSAPLPEDDLALFGPDPSTAPQDGYTLETRAESTSVLTLGNAVRRGELDTVQIGNAGIADIVAGTETATISGKLREHNGRDMNYIASRVETTVGGRMSVTCGFEDGIMLGGAMTDTWAGATMIGAVMSDDLCAGAGVRATAPVDLWLNMLTGMEERPGTAAADGVFVEACGTLFEREYGPSVYAVGTAMWTGTTYVTMKTGFRPLMRVAMGVRNLLPGAGAAAEEPPPPAPPAGPPAAAGGVVAVAGMVTGMAHMSRATANVGLSADNLADAARAGEAAADMASAHNAADLRHSADTAAQIEDLRSQANFALTEDWAATSDDLFMQAAEMDEINPRRAAAMTDAADQLDVAKARILRGEDPRPGLLAKAKELDDLGYADEAAVLRRAADSYGDSLDAGTSVRPRMEVPDPDPVEMIDAYATTPINDDLTELIDPYAASSVTNVAPRPVPVQNAKDAVHRTTIGWLGDAAPLYGDANKIRDTDPRRAEALEEAASRMEMAFYTANTGSDPRPGLKAAAAGLEDAGYPDLAQKLMAMSGDFDDLVAKFTVADGNLASGILDHGKRMQEIVPPSPEDANFYSTVGSMGTGPTRGPLGSDPSDSLNIRDRYRAWLSMQDPELLEAAKLPDGFDVGSATSRIDDMIDSSLAEFRIAAGPRISQEQMARLDELAGLGDSAADQRRAAVLQAELEALDVLKTAIDNNEDPVAAVGMYLFMHLDAHGVANPEASGYQHMVKYTKGLVDDLGPGMVAQGELDLLRVARAEIERGRDPCVAMQNLIGVMADGTPGMDELRNVLDEIGGGPWRQWAGEEDLLTVSVLGGTPSVSFNPGHAESVGEAGTPRALTPDGSDLGSAPGAGSFGQQDEVTGGFEQVYVPGRLPDPGIDDSRHLVAIEPEQALGRGEDAAGAAGRGAETGSGAADSARGAEAGSPGGLADPDIDDARHLADGGPEQVSGAGGAAAAAQPQLDEGGARWDVGSGSRSPDADTGEHRAEGNYADVSHRSDAADGAAGDAADGVAGGTAGDGAAGGTSTAQATPPDTQAVVDAMPDTSVTGDAGGAAAESDWRHWLAQADETAGSGALDWSQMNDQLFQQYMQYRRDSNWRALIAYGDVFDQMRAELVKALIEVGGYSDEAANAIPTGRAAYAALAEIVDQAGNAGDWAAVQRVGGFLDAFDLRTQDTLTDLASRADELEGVKNHQALWVRPGSVHDLDMGVDRPKLADHFISRQEDAARRMQEASAAGDADAAARLNNEMTYYQQMSVTLERGRNPLVESSEQIAYLRSVGEHAQADEYMELHGQLMETLRNPDFHRDVGAHGYASSSVMRPDLSGHPQPLHTDSYVPGTIDDIDMRSFLRAEVDESGGAAAHGDAAVQANAGDYDAGRDMVNQQVGGADCVRAPQEEPVWVEGPGLTSILKKSDPTGKPSNITSSKGGVEDLMEQRVEIAHGTVGAVRGGTPDMATRVAAANDFWGATAKVDQRAFGQWKGRPQGMRSWKSPTQRAAKGVRFGADHARVLTYTDDVVGLGDTSRTMRYVQAPGGWMPTRQPGFGRTASAAGDFPFSVREQVLNSLMQGKHIDAESSTALHREFFLARGERYATAASKSDWLKMDMLLRNLEMTHLPTVAQGPAFARSFDGKTLGKLLDLFESSASVA